MELNFDPLYHKYPSKRYPIYAANGMVNCSNPLAAAAGLEILQKGGNAADAAIAAATALTVVEPTSNGIGSDAFAIIWSERSRKLFGLNSSGRAPMLASIQKIRDEKRDSGGKMPVHGWTSVTVPGAPAAWALAQKELQGRKLILGLYIVLMLLPFQVLMAPSYFVLRRLSLLDTPWAIILPGVFSTLPVFLMSRSFSGIPPELIEAAKLDGANAIQIFVKIGLPLGRPGILAAAVLSFLEAWSAIEQPMSFLRSQEHWPFSLFLPVISSENLASGLAAGLITLIPAVLIFKFGQKYLELGIQAEGGLG